MGSDNKLFDSVSGSVGPVKQENGYPSFDTTGPRPVYADVIFDSLNGEFVEKIVYF
jgi:hypothetical protein